METIDAARDEIRRNFRHDSRRHAVRQPASCTWANVVFLHWLAAPGYYLVLAPSDPAQKSGPRSRYVGPVSSPVAAEMLKTSALALGVADRAFEETQ